MAMHRKCMLKSCQAAVSRCAVPLRPRLLQPPGSPGYKYSTVVRKRDQRELLQAVDCAQCAAFFKAIASWGAPVEGPGMVCQHGEGGGGQGCAPLLAWIMCQL